MCVCVNTSLNASLHHIFCVHSYGQQTLTKEQYHEFCMEMMAQTAISSKPTVGTLVED